MRRCLNHNDYKFGTEKKCSKDLAISIDYLTHNKKLGRKTVSGTISIEQKFFYRIRCYVSDPEEKLSQKATGESVHRVCKSN